MLTTVRSATKEVSIGDERPTALIGERINPTGKKKLAASLQAGNMDVVRREAIMQVEAGADILDVNVGAAGLDQVKVLPQAVKVVMEAVEAPICIDSDNPEALDAALKVYKGKPIINSVTGEERSLSAVLPLVKGYGAAVIALTMDDEGIPTDVERRVAIAHRIVERAASMGIPAEDVIVDCATMTAATDTTAPRTILETIRRVKAELGANLTSGASNVSFGLPDRETINSAFLALVLGAGVTCPIVDAAKMLPTVLATDLLLGRDEYCMRFIRSYRQRQKALQEQAAQSGEASGG
jgi:5-methyltetrahydrofolate--homocysteine methyltransferase